MIQSSLSFITTSPFFSSIITLYTLLFLYLPPFLLPIISSPIFFFTLILLLHLLRLGFSQRSPIKPHHPKNAISEQLHIDQNIAPKLEFLKPEESGEEELNSETHVNQDSDTFVEWDVRAPLEVIYEANSGEEEGRNGEVLAENRETQMAIIEKYASLSKYYPETDTESSSSEMDFPAAGDGDSPENDGFRWEEEEGEGLIEIELHGKVKVEVEEENLIEIDLSPAR